MSAVSVSYTFTATPGTNTSVLSMTTMEPNGDEKSIVCVVSIFDTSSSDGVISSLKIQDNNAPGGTGDYEFTKADEYYDSTCDGHVSIWYINESDVPTEPLDSWFYSVVITTTGTVSDIMAGLIYLDKEISLDATATPATNNGSPTITWSTSDPDTIAVSAALSDQSVGARITCNDTSLFIEDVGGDTALGCYAIRTSSESQTLDWTDSDNDEDWVAVGASFTGIDSALSISETDGLTIGESTSVELSDLTFSVSDGITVGDSPTPG
jgi:hypothetical protein